jgi:hypothetical protein
MLLAAGLVVLVSAAGPAPVKAQNKPTWATAVPTRQSAMRASYDAYLIGPSDALEVELQDIPE